MIKCGHWPNGSKEVELLVCGWISHHSQVKTEAMAVTMRMMQYSRHHATINHNASLEPDQLGMLAVVEGVLADLRSAPAVDRNVEVGAWLERRDEAGHRRQTKRAPILAKLGVRDDMAAHLELLQGNSSISTRGEEKHVPVVVAHDDDGGNG